MVRIRGTLNDDLTRFFHDSIQGPLDDFCSKSACAGIRDNHEAAKKARGNHYGEYYLEDGNTTYIPVRQFIWAATKDTYDGNVGFTAREISEILTKTINAMPRVQRQALKATVKVGTTVNAWGEPTPVYKDVRRTTQRALPVLKGNNYNGVFEKLAETMRRRLVDAIEERDIVGSDKPRIGGTTKVIWASSKYGQVVGDIRDNAPSTIAAKGGRNTPLIDTGEMIDSIEGWKDG
jgi:hypothetical protein